MRVEAFAEIVGSDFYTGVPDSQLKPLCDYLIHTYGTDSKHHLIAANEGNCAALAAGYHLATGKIPVIYMQNSGEGNAINPIASLLNERVYAIPAVFVIGWRGEPGLHDEPQHIYQGSVTIKLLEDMDVSTFIVEKETTEADIQAAMERFRILLTEGKQVAFVIRKGALSYDKRIEYRNEYTMPREEILRHILEVSGEDVIISTTGKTSREVFEIREAGHQSHKYDFLTVGSMGHTSSIAFGVATHRPEARVWCIDGDGAALMHMGAMALLGFSAPRNLIHILLNNGAHESVGGMPTVARRMDWVAIARGCGYPYAVSVDTFAALDAELKAAKERGQLMMIEVKCAIGSRENLGRPTTSARENKENFMGYLINCKERDEV